MLKFVLISALVAGASAGYASSQYAGAATQTFATPGATAEASASQLGHYRHDPQQQYSQQQSWQLDQGNLPTSYSNVYNPSYVAGYDGGLYGSNK